MKRGMIVSVGKTIEPVVKTIAEFKPNLVFFLTSQETIDYIARIKQNLKEMGVGFEDKKFLIEEPENLVRCYEAARASCREMSERGIEPGCVLVDYTGGTKSMTAGLILAATRYGYNFAYVGGKERDEAGRVTTGAEEVLRQVSPWVIFAIEEKRRVAQYFNSYSFKAAARALTLPEDKIRQRERKLFSILKEIALGYAAWERFDHKEALNRLQKWVHELDTLLAGGAEEDLRESLETAKENLDFLGRFKAESNGFKKMCHSYVIDLLSNASRRMEEGKNDDAVARLYRALEMIGQIAFKERFGGETDDVEIDKIPEEFREEFEKRYKDEQGKVKIGLYESFRVLKEKGDAIGLAYEQKEKEFQGLLAARNQSILAHGSVAMSREAAKKFQNLISDTFAMEPSVKFPKLPWT